MALPIIETAAVDVDWRRKAACRTIDPNLFFPSGFADPSAVADRAMAKALCSTCPCKQPCLDFAMETRQEFGVWGGLDEQERLALRRARRRSA